MRKHERELYIIDSEDARKYLSLAEKQQLSFILRSIEISKELEGNNMVEGYICPNCKGKMVETESGVLQCVKEDCEVKILKDDYGAQRIILVDSCWICPAFCDKIVRACNITGNEISGKWWIDPSCPLKRCSHEMQ